MKLNSLYIVLSILLFSTPCLGQYEFTGNVDPETWEGDVYLSVIEDYRKISGVYPEQILAQTSPDSSGYFRFSGNNLPNSNRIYRIHIDNCKPNEQAANHFLGHCENSKEVLFIANNSDKLELPFSFDQEMFCKVVSNNEKANTLLKIDSIKNDMKFAFGTYRSAANRKINSKKWFKTLQNYGEQLNEPLAELYIFNFLSDPRSELHAYYLKDLSDNTYYDKLKTRLEANYPNTSYAQQFAANLRSDKVLIGS
ncbi:MAG: helix-turn-helix transcriptional regulator, partial [Flavobacteriaceae bacterium]|nr:helix-turn-helix transcriptional regulator [Flavobacteriaceae bacterium]